MNFLKCEDFYEKFGNKNRKILAVNTNSLHFYLKKQKLMILVFDYIENEGNEMISFKM